MEFNFDFNSLREVGDALKNFGKSTDKKIEDYKKVKEEYEEGRTE